MNLIITLTASLLLIACAREGAIAPSRAGVVDQATPGAIAHQGDALAGSTPSEGAPRPTGDRIKMRHLRLSSPQEKVRWEKAVDALWRTPLGELYSEYLFSPTADHSDLPLWARMLANRIFRDESHLMVRLLALQIMNEDLYVREKLVPDVSNRVNILQGHFEQKETLVTKASRRSENFVNVALVGASVVYGFGGARSLLGRAGRVGERTFRKLMRREAATVWPMMGKAAGESAASFSPKQAATFLGYAFIPMQAAEIGIDAYYASSAAPRDYEMLLGMDDQILEMEAPDSLTLPDEHVWSQFKPPIPPPAAVVPASVTPTAKN